MDNRTDLALAPPTRARSLVLAVAGLAVLLGVALPQSGRAASYDPPPISSIPADSSNGFPGYPGYDAKAFDTNAYATNQSCQAKLNDEINTLVHEILEIPAASTQAESDANNAAIHAIQAEAKELGNLRPACGQLHAGAPVATKPFGGLKATPGDRYLFLRLFCPGYSACIVQGTAAIDTARKIFTALGGKRSPAIARGGHAKRIFIGKGSFSLGAGNKPRIRIPISSRGRKLLKRLGQLKVRIDTTATYVGDGTRVESRVVRTLKGAG